MSKDEKLLSQKTEKERNVGRYFNLVASIWRRDKVGTKDFEPKTLKLFIQNIPKDGYILDIGCGPGTHAFFFEGYKYLGIDISYEMIKYARTEYPSRDFEVMNSRSIGVNLKPNYFNGVWCIRTLLHLEKKYVPDFLKSVFAVMKSNGVFCCVTPSGEGESYQPAPKVFGFKNKKVFVAFWKLDELLKIVKDIGFENLDSYKDGSILSLLLRKP